LSYFDPFSHPANRKILREKVRWRLEDQLALLKLEVKALHGGAQSYGLRVYRHEAGPSSKEGGQHDFSGFEAPPGREKAAKLPDGHSIASHQLADARKRRALRGILG